jgi:polyisoprenoid-binding protein YceI
MVPRMFLLGLLAAAVSLAPTKTTAAGEVDLMRSRVYTRVGKTGLGHEHGVVGLLKSGTVQLGAKSAAGRLVFDMTSFAADTDEARKYVGLDGTTAEGTRKQVNDNMLGADVLNVKQFPTATFEIESAQATGKTSSGGNPLYVLRGKFTLHGAARPLSVTVEAAEVKGGVHVRGNFSILQTEYGMKPYTAALGAVGVADKLTIFGDLLVTK